MARPAFISIPGFNAPQIANDTWASLTSGQNKGVLTRKHYRKGEYIDNDPNKGEVLEAVEKYAFNGFMQERVVNRALEPGGPRVPHTNITMSIFAASFMGISRINYHDSGGQTIVEYEEIEYEESEYGGESVPSTSITTATGTEPETGDVIVMTASRDKFELSDRTVDPAGVLYEFIATRIGTE